MTFNQSLILLIVAICFGYIVLTFVEMMAAIAFWAAVGVAVSAAGDVAVGVGRVACKARASVRSWWNRGAPVAGTSNVIRGRF